MSTRERWIVYPLLFLILGIVMRDKFFPAAAYQAKEVTALQVRCNQLLSVEEITTRQLHCTLLLVDKVRVAGGIVVPGIQCGELQVTGPNGRPTVVVGTDLKTKGGLIKTMSSAGNPLVLLQPTDSGGVVLASEYRKMIAVPSSPERQKSPSKPDAKQPPKAAEKADVKGDK
jgi:hypothetical protein